MPPPFIYIYIYIQCRKTRVYHTSCEQDPLGIHRVFYRNKQVCKARKIEQTEGHQLSQ